ncbi:MAG: hypothetical protein ABI301_05590, partial [Jatrophihabitantaceae bacterium]
RFADRIASFTSISGPSLDHARRWLRSARQHPLASARQLLASYYIAFFQLPVLPETVMGSRAIDRMISGPLTGRRTEADRRNGIQLYRANLRPRRGRPEPQRTSIPVQVLAPTHDAFVSTALQTQAPAPYVSDLTTRTVSGGHWVIAERPDVIARCVTEFVYRVDGGTGL